MNELPNIGRSSSSNDLRRAFDLSFSHPPSADPEGVEDLLMIRVTGHPYAIRLRDIAGLVTKRTVIPVRTANNNLLGLVGIRGEIVPAFGLASLLGHAEPLEGCRWMVICGSEAPIALCFSEFEHYVRLPASSMHSDAGEVGPLAFSRELARTSAGVRPVIALSSLLATIRNRTVVTDRNRSNDQ